MKPGIHCCDQVTTGLFDLSMWFYDIAVVSYQKLYML